MGTKAEIIKTQKEIEKCMAFLMDTIKERLSAERIRTYKDEEGNIKSRKDARYEFNLKFDELPYFSLYVNLKKAVYEILLVPCHVNKALSKYDYEELEKVGVLKTNNDKLKFKPLKEFVPKTKLIPDMTLDLDALEEYLDEIEFSLLSSIHSAPIWAILINLVDCEKSAKNRIGADGVLPYNTLDENDDVNKDLLYTLKKETEGNWFYSRVADEIESIMARDAGKGFLFPCGEHIGWSYMNEKAAIDSDPTSEKGHRNNMIQRLNDSQSSMFYAVLDTVVNVLAIPAYEIPHETILDILEQTLAGMKRVVFAKKLDTYTSGDTKLFSKGELTAALGCRSEKFSNYTNIYGEKSFAEEEIHTALEKLGQPVHLLDF